MPSPSLAILITARNTASGVLGGISKEVDSLGSKAAGAGKAMAAGLAIGAGALLGLGAAAFKIGGDFDSAYDAIRVGTGATGEALQGLKGDFKEVVKDVPTDFGTASQVIADLNTRTGATGATLQELSKNILEMSRITKTDATANVAAATRVFGDWGVVTEDQTRTLDMLFRASQATGIGLGDLQGKVVQFGAPLRAMGFSLGESAAMLGKWEKEGVNTELVLGSLRIAMGKFAKDNVPMRTGLEQTMATIQKLGPGAAATSLAMETFGARAGPDMAAAILEGRFSLGELLAQIEGGSETILGAAADTADLGEKWQKTLNRMTVAVEPLASKVFDFVGTLMDDAAPLLVYFGEVVGRVFSGDIKGALGLFRSELAWTAEDLAAQLGNWAKAFVDWVSPMIPPMLKKLGELAGKAFEWVKAQIGPLMDQLGKWGRQFVDWIAPMIPPLLEEAQKLYVQLVKWIWGTALPGIAKQLAEWTSAFVDWVMQAAPPLITEAGKLASKLLDWLIAEGPVLARTFIREWVPAALKWVGQTAIDILPKLYELTGNVVGWLLTVGVPKLVEAGWKIGQELIGGIMDGLDSLASQLWNKLMDIIEAPSIEMPSFGGGGGNGGGNGGSFLAGVTGWAGEDWANAVRDTQGNIISVPKLPGFQHGGIVPGPLGRPTLAVVHGGETVTPAGRAGVTVNLHVYGSVITERDLIRTVRDGLQGVGRSNLSVGLA